MNLRQDVHALHLNRCFFNKRASLVALLSLAASAILSCGAGVVDFEDLVAGAPGGAGGPSVVLSNQCLSSGVVFENAQGFDYYGYWPGGFAHSGSKAIEPWAAAWSDWTALGGYMLQPGVAMGGNPADSTNVFVVGGDGTVYRSWRVTYSGGAYMNWEWLGAPTGVQFWPPAATGRNADGRREVFALGNDGAIYHNFETSLVGPWSGWYSLGGWALQGPITVNTNADGRLQVFTRGSDDCLYCAFQNSPNGSWSTFFGVGDRPLPMKAYAVEVNTDGRLEVVAVGQDGVLWDIYQGTPNGAWSVDLSLGGWNLQGAVALGRNADGRLEAYVVGGDGVVYRNAQSTPGIGSWTGFASMAHPALTTVANMTVNSLKDGRLFLLLRQADGTLFYRTQVAPNGGWGAPISLGGANLQWPVTIARDFDSRLELWAIGNDGQVYNRQMGTLYPNGQGYVSPLTMDFTRPQRQLSVWAGYSASPGSDHRVILRGFDAGGQEIASTVAAVGNTISTPLTLTASSGNLVRATVGYLATEAGLAVNDGLALDDLALSASDDPAWLVMLGVGDSLAGRQVYLRYYGPPNQSATIEASDNLVSWLPVRTFTAPTSPYDITITPPWGSPRQFYRLALPAAQYAPGDKMLVIQGLSQNTLVAGKTTALRLFAGPVPLAEIATVEAAFLRPDGIQATRSWSLGDFSAIPQSSQGPSVVVTIPGNQLPMVGDYYFSARLLNQAGQLLGSYKVDRVSMLPTKDLRIMVDRVWSGTSTKPGEIEAAQAALERLAALFPVRDGISALDGDRSAGLRYQIHNDPLGPPNQDGQLCPLFASWQNRPSSEDSIDLGLAYRFPNAAEGCGGADNRVCPGQSMFWELMVWQEPLAGVFAHQAARALGRVVSSSATLDRLEVDLGFDAQLLQPFPTPVYDLMYAYSPCPGYDPSRLSFSSSDWESLRQQLVNGLAASTGPTGPSLQWEYLGGWLLQPSLAVGRNADGRREVFAVGGDGVLYDQWENSPGGTWSGWASLAGWQMQIPVVTGTDADGRLEVFTHGGSDNAIWYRSQTSPNCCWSQWWGLGNYPLAIKGYALNSNTDGRLEIIAVGQDGGLWDVYQGAPNQGWSVWLSLGGTALSGPVALGRNVDGRLEGFVVGGNGVVYRNAQTQPGIGSWTGFFGMAHAALSTVTNLAVSSLNDGRLFLLLRQADGTLLYRAQVVPNGGWGDPVWVGGSDLQWPVSIGRAADGRLELWAVGTDGQVHSRWQIALDRPDAWSDWTALGGTNLQPAIGLSANPAGNLEVFVLGADGALWRGWR